MRKLFSIVLTIAMLVTVFSTVFNLRTASAASNDYLKMLTKQTQQAAPTSTKTQTSLNPTPTSILSTSKPSVPSSNFTVTIGTICASSDEYITVPINFANVPASGIQVFDMSIQYESDCLEYLAYEPGIIVPNPNINFVINKSENGTLKLLFLGYSLENEFINSNGTLANITFKVSSSEAVSTSIRVDNSNFGDHNFNFLYPTLVEGLVYISGVSQATPIPQNSLKVIVGSTNANSGDIITVPVAFENIPSNGISMCGMTILYDKERLEFVSHKPGVIVNNPDINFGINNMYNGAIKLHFIDNTISSEPITSDGVFVDLTFRVTDSYDSSTSINLINSTFGDIDTNIVFAQIVPGVIDITGRIIPTPTPAGKLTVNIGSTEGMKGDLITVPISLQNVPYSGIAGGDLIISFDTNQLEYVDKEPGNITSNLAISQFSDGNIRLLLQGYINSSDSGYVKSDGILATITFKILGAFKESTPLEAKVSFTVDHLEKIDVSVNSGMVNIIGPVLPTLAPTPKPTNSTVKITVGSAEGTTGELVTVPVSLANISPNGIGAADIRIKYDSVLLECVSVEAGNIVPTPERDFFSSNTSEAIIELLYTKKFANSSCISTDGVFANITFKVLCTYDKSTYISVSNPSVEDRDLLDIYVYSVAARFNILGIEPKPDFQVEIGSTKGYTGDLITVPVNFSYVPNTRISTASMTINYDASQLEYISYKVGSIVPEGGLGFDINKTSDGVLSLLYLDYFMQSSIDYNGIVANLTFKVLGSSGESAVYGSDAIFSDRNFDYVNTTFVSGKVSISAPPLFSEKIGVYYGSFYQTLNEPCTFPIVFKNIPPTAIGSFSMTIDYDPTRLEYADAAELNIVTPDPEVLYTIKTLPLTIQKISEKSFRILYEASETLDLITNEYGFVHLDFNILSPSTNDISIKIKDATFTDKYGNPVDAELFSAPTAEAAIGTVAASPNSTVVVPINLISLPEPGISSTYMVIDYNPEELEYISSKFGSIIPELVNITVNPNSFDNSKIRLFINMYPNSLTTNGDLANITFKVKATDGFSPLKFEYVPEILLSSDLWSKVLITNGGVIISDKEFTGQTVSGYVYSDLGNANSPNFSFNEGFKVELEGSSFSTVTDSNGYFEIKNVPFGKYTLSITKANHLTRQIENLSVDEDKELSSPIILWPGDMEIDGIQDGAINLEDIMEICKAFNCTYKDVKYNKNLDLNKDSSINLEDIMLVIKHFNKTSSDY